MTAEEFALRLEQDCAVPHGGHVLAAVSGGADSTALLCFLCDVRASYPLTVSCAHVEHGIRGDDSLEDMVFVRRLCEQKNVPFYAERVDAPHYARAYGGVEAAARALRYDFLRRTAHEIGADCIALAHHAQDQAETVLLHALRGSDLRGLCAMRPRRNDLIRPLLFESPQALREALRARGQTWREDATNQNEAYARNRLRLTVLPQMELACPGAAAALCRLAAAAQRDDDYFSARLEGEKVLGGRALVNGWALPRTALGAQHNAVASRALCAAIAKAGLPAQDAQTLGALLRLIRSDGCTAMSLAGDGIASLGAHWLCLTRHVLSEPVPLSLAGETLTPFGLFTVRAACPEETGDGVREQVFSSQQLHGAVIAQRRAGDTMIPFGGKKPVRLKKLFSGAGVERAVRASVPVLRQGDEILWLVGLRPAACAANLHGERLLVRWDGAWPHENNEG